MMLISSYNEKMLCIASKIIKLVIKGFFTISIVLISYVTLFNLYCIALYYKYIFCMNTHVGNVVTKVINVVSITTGRMYGDRLQN